jgi:Asp/Glu/hydantoin racemase
MNKTVVIIHTTPVTVNSLKPLTGELLKGCTIYNFLDDSILPQVIAGSGISENVKFRVYNLLMNATTIKPDAILCACSSIGELIDSARPLTDIPLFRIDEPMVKEAVEKGVKIGVAATLISTLEPTRALLIRKSEEAGKAVKLESMLIDGAGDLLNTGREQEFDELVSSKLMELAHRNEIVILAQASMTRALCKIREDQRDKFLTSPKSGILAVKNLLEV